MPSQVWQAHQGPLWADWTCTQSPGPAVRPLWQQLCSDELARAAYWTWLSALGSP